MEKAIRVRVSADYVFFNKDEAEAFMDFKRAEGAECPEMRSLSVDIVNDEKKQLA
jgi:hypothetical protein